MSYYCDSSAIAKIYLQEAGSAFMRNLRQRHAAGEIIITDIAGPEVISAIYRRNRKGDLSAETFSQALADFNRDFNGFFARISVSEAIINLAMQLIGKYILRGYDSVQLATAVQLQGALQITNGYEINFVCSDKTLIEAARNEGLTVINPAEQE